MKNIWEKVKRNLVWILLIAGVVSVPLMTDYVLAGSELASTLSHIEVISQGIGRLFPVRIVPWVSMDYGYAAASFQADIFYLPPVLLRLAGMGVGSAYKWTLLLYHVGTAGIACFCFSRCCGGREAGITAGMLYTWCPYRLSQMYIVGDLGETAAWMCFPILLMGLKVFFTETEKKKQDGNEGKQDNNLWKLLVLGYSLLLLSSTAVWAAAMGMTVFLLIFMGRKALQRFVLVTMGKTMAVFTAVNAWFFIPMLMRMREASVTAALVTEDFRGKGMYPAQYLKVFGWGGDNVRLFENGLYQAMDIGPGIGVILLVFLWLWALFTRQCEEGQKRDFAARMLWVSGVMIVLGSNWFPWDLLQNRNMLCSILLALLYSPAKLGICVCVGMVTVACGTLVWMEKNQDRKAYQMLLLLITAVSFAATQFLLGNIMRTRGVVKGADIEVLSSVPLPLVMQESVSWRICEAVSVVAFCGWIVAWAIRRQKGEQVG